MRVYTKIVFDLEGSVVESVHYEYSGPVAECKRGAAKSEADQLVQQDQARALALSKIQQQMVSPETSFLQNMISNPTGFTPADLAAMRTQAIQNTQNQYATGLQQLKTQLAARGLYGGATPTSGIAGSNFGQYQALGAQAMSQNLSNINIQNALQAQQNRWNAGNLLGQYTSLLNPGAFVGGAGGAMESRTQLETAPTTLGKLGAYWGSLGGIRQ